MIAPRTPYFVLPDGRRSDHIGVSCGDRVRFVSAGAVYRNCLLVETTDDCPPLVKGGQGRTGREVVGAWLRTSWLARIVAVAAAATAIWSLVSQ